MYPSLPFGPFSLPTAPVVALVAVTIGLELAGRYGRRLGLATDDVWNAGLITFVIGLIVARLWNVIQFWSVYIAEPLLILSLRPSGFAWAPGLVAGIVAGYSYLARRALDPWRVLAAFCVGGMAAASLLAAGSFLTGRMVGIPSTAPWALPYFGEMRHPVALYEALGLWLLFMALWLKSSADSPSRTILLTVLGYSVVRLLIEGFLEESPLFAGFRLRQVAALLIVLISSWRLGQVADNK